jgi:sugar phosphate isomerase/epimerase
MLTETVDDWAALAGAIKGLRLALDVGHCLVTGERDPAAAVREFADRIGTVSIEDMRRGEHVHLAFGEARWTSRGSSTRWTPSASTASSASSSPGIPTGPIR